jgi:L-lactate dehydrogenase
MSSKSKKVVILGAGHVGATIAYTLTLEGVVGEIALLDINREKAKGEAMDIIQGTAFCPPVNIYAGDYPDAAGADIVIVTMGMPRTPGQSRIDLAQVNVEIAKSVMSRVVKFAPDAVYVVVSNPVDILTYAILKTTGLPERQVLGSGTMLDSSRLRTMLAEYVDLNPKNVHAYVLGEHGDSSVVPWSRVTIGGMTLADYWERLPAGKTSYSPEYLLMIENEVRGAGAKVIAGKGATYYAIALTVKRIVECIIRDTGSILTVSGMLSGEYGIRDIALSLPFIVGRQGIVRSIAPPLNEDEETLLQKSAEALKQTIRSLTI